MLSFEIKKWFIHGKGGKAGPVSLLDLRNERASGRLQDSTLISAEGRPAVALKDLPEFKSYLDANLSANASPEVDLEDEKTVLASRPVRDSANDFEESEATVVMSPTQKAAIAANANKTKKTEPAPAAAKTRAEPEIVRSLELETKPTTATASPVTPSSSPAPASIARTTQPSFTPRPQVATPKPKRRVGPLTQSKSWPKPKPKSPEEPPKKYESKPAPAPVPAPVIPPVTQQAFAPPPDLIEELNENEEENVRYEVEDSSPSSDSDSDSSSDSDSEHPSLGVPGEGSGTDSAFDLKETDLFIKRGSTGYSKASKVKKIIKIPPKLILGGLALGGFGVLALFFTFFSSPNFGKPKNYGTKASAIITSFDKISETTYELDFKELEYVAGTAVNQTGPKAAVALSISKEATGKEDRAVFYVASNMPPGTNLSLSVENPVVTPSLIWMGNFQQPTSHLMEIHTSVKLPLPPEIHVFVFEGNEQTSEVTVLLNRLGQARRIPSVNEAKKLVITKKYTH